MNSVRSSIRSLKYQRFKPSVCKDIRVWKFLFDKNLISLTNKSEHEYLLIKMVKVKINVIYFHSWKYFVNSNKLKEKRWKNISILFGLILLFFSYFKPLCKIGFLYNLSASPQIYLKREFVKWKNGNSKRKREK